jgi:hypothetical protein
MHKEVLTLPREPRGVHTWPVEASTPEVPNRQQQPKLWSILVQPDVVSPPPSSRPCACPSGSASMKASGQAASRSMKGAAAASNLGWQMVQLKIWRKKFSLPCFRPPCC